MTFDEFDLDPRCLRVLEGQGITEPTPIQELAIPPVLTGRDLIATAQTGTGKTLAFSLPTLSRLAGEKPGPNRMLVLTPTRELAQQVESVINPLAKKLRLSSVVVYGGAGMQLQADRLRRGCDIIVATPGRLLDHMGRGYLRFTHLDILVFDEADRMLDMGFLPDIRRIISKLPKERQTLMFSATFATELRTLCADMMHDPERVGAGPVARPVDTVRQVVYPVRQDEKSKLLLQILRESQIDSALVFMRTKHRTDRLGRMLKEAGFNATFIHGDLSQAHRQRALEGFRSGKANILVATDVAARGLDVDGISHVINYDIPQTADDYIHRIGRTARAQREGDAITFVCPNEHSALGAIEKALGQNLPRKDYEGAPVIISVYHAPGTKGATAGAAASRRMRGRSLLRRR
jgi:ATP-dependent RNA helicase RhlE